jgi:hypothetical protein
MIIPASAMDSNMVITNLLHRRERPHPLADVPNRD